LGVAGVACGTRCWCDDDGQTGIGERRSPRYIEAAMYGLVQRRQKHK